MGGFEGCGLGFHFDGFLVVGRNGIWGLGLWVGVVWEWEMEGRGEENLRFGFRARDGKLNVVKIEFYTSVKLILKVRIEVLTLETSVLIIVLSFNDFAVLIPDPNLCPMRRQFHVNAVSK